MQSMWPKKIREILREEEEGCTIAELSDRLHANKNSIASALERMPDAYIDRWTEAGQGRPYEGIWCAVIPPENCPYPTKKM